MDANLISVIIPVYNTAEYLPRCLDSILNNTYRNLEIICVNDGSPDNSLEILNDYAARDSRIKVIDQKNAGVSAARNRGLDEATGEYIAFVDSDDWVHRQYFEVLLRCILESGADIQVCDEIHTQEIPSDAAIQQEFSENAVLDERCSLENSLNVCKRLYKKRIVGDTRFSSEIRIGEDSVFNLELHHNTNGVRMAYIRLPMYYYYIRPGSAMHTLQGRDLKHLVFWYREHLDSAPSDAASRHYVIDGAKKSMNWRYGIRYAAQPGEKEQIAGVVRLFRTRLMSSRCIGAKEKLIYTVLLTFPYAYRLFRIISDPTLLYWERNQRKLLREEKKKK